MATNNEVIERIDNLKESIGNRLDDIESLAKQNRDALKGNGKQGLETRVALVEDAIKRISWIGGLLMALLIGDIVTRVLSHTLGG